MAKPGLTLQDPAQDLSNEIELEIVKYMKFNSAKGMLEHTINDILDGLENDKKHYPRSQVSNALALLSDKKRGVLSKRMKGVTAFYCFQTIVSLCDEMWGN